MAAGRMQILLFGANGQVGHELARSLPALGTLVALDRSQADLEDPASIAAAISRHRPDIVINAAAYTAVDRAESEPEKARRINALAPAAMAAELARLGGLLVHYSTDYVFDGTKPGPYLETDPTNPLSVYGATKLEGERLVAASGCRHLIFRTSWVYADRGHNFLKTILRLARERESLSIVADQTGVPTSAALLARVAAEALARCSGPEPARPESGIYHLCPAGLTSWHDYARFIVAEAIAAGAPLRATVESVLPIPSSAYPTPARRPANSQLDTSKLRRALGCPLPPWEDDVRVALRAILSFSPSEEPASR
jgi:dTDP-4-dehydrorhamnose reductase